MVVKDRNVGACKMRKIVVDVDVCRSYSEEWNLPGHISCVIYCFSLNSLTESRCCIFKCFLLKFTMYKTRGLGSNCTPGLQPSNHSPARVLGEIYFKQNHSNQRGQKGFDLDKFKV